MELIIFIMENNDRKIKGLACANGIIKWDWMNKQGVSSPTVSLESVIMAAILENDE